MAKIGDEIESYPLEKLFGSSGFGKFFLKNRNADSDFGHNY